MEPFIIFTLKSSLCLTAGFLLYSLLLKRETFHRFKRFVLLGIILISLVLPVIKLNMNPVGMNSPVQKLESTYIGITPGDIPLQKPGHFPVSQKRARTVGYVTLIYLAGAIIQLVLILYSLTGIILLVRRSKKITYQGVRLRLIPADVIPFCFGRRIVLSEKDFSEHGKEVIIHELTHLKEGHGLDLFISELFLVITWYNPASWLIRYELRQNHEFEADRSVLRQGVDESEYQLLLVRAISGAARFNLANQLNQSNLKTRINMMNKTKSNPRAILKALFFIPLLVLMVQVFALKEIKPASATTNNPGQGRYLELPPDHLKLMGFEYNKSGLYYKNTRFGRSDKGILCLYFTSDVYSTSIVLHQGEKITGHSAPEKFLKNQALTNFDFYPVVVTGFNGTRTQDMSAAEKDPGMKLLPVQINMADLKLGKRSDTLIFWFKPTDALKQVLAPITKIDEYLQTCP